MLTHTLPAGLISRSTTPYVLLVDDHEPTLSRLQSVMQSAGFECVTSSSAAEALAVSDSRRPSLVITDLRMPSLDGPALGRWLKARYPSIPLILVTGELLDAASQRDLTRNFAGIFSKPLNVEPFLLLIDDLMPRSFRAPRP